MALDQKGSVHFFWNFRKGHWMTSFLRVWTVIDKWLAVRAASPAIGACVKWYGAWYSLVYGWYGIGCMGRPPGDVLLLPHPLTPSDSHPHNYPQPSAIPSMSAIHLITSNHPPHTFVLSHHFKDIQANYLHKFILHIRSKRHILVLNFGEKKSKKGGVISNPNNDRRNSGGT